ncbi:MAG: hypothetical protein LQ337_002863 [Flavoplaca oasis]|nr:MAG: hypothetical protein LQ337_002863 [Flavoplaca oasis]
MAEVSSTRLYLGNLPRDVTKEDIQTHFKEAPGTIAEVKLMNGFGFIEYEDAMDARDVVPTYRTYFRSVFAGTLLLKKSEDGSDLNGSRLTVQFARGARQRNEFAGPPERPHPRPRRTAHRMQITGLPGETSWQDLKDFARRSGLDVVYSEVGRDRDGKGFVEFETAADLKVAVDKLDNNEFKGATVGCVSDVCPDPTLSRNRPPTDCRHSRRMRFHATIVTAVPARHHRDVVLTLRKMDTTIVALRLENTRHVSVTTTVVVVRHHVTMTITPATIVATDLHHPAALAVVHPLKIRIRLLVEATTATHMQHHRPDAPTTTPMLPTDMGDRESEVPLREDMADTMSGHATGDCSFLLPTLVELLRGGALELWNYLHELNGAYDLRTSEVRFSNSTLTLFTKSTH